MCKELSIGRASYYKWRKRKPSMRDEENRVILQVMQEIVAENNSLFGSYPMMITVNKRLRKKYNLKRIARLMCVNDIHSAFRPKKKSSWRNSTPEEVAENILNRDFEAKGPNEKYCTDVTETKIPGTNVKLYISTILDLYDRYPVGYSISKRNDVALVNESLDMVLDKHFSDQTIFHSDRGFQYTRSVFNKTLLEHGFIQSMSRVGHCIDNGPIEGFQGIMKDEIYILYDIKTAEDFIEAFPKYINHYIYERPQKRYKGKTPYEVRTEALASLEPLYYPIPNNPKIEAYWKDIENKQKEA